MVTKPTINPITPIDKTIGGTVTFTLTYSTTLIKNKLTLYRVSTNEIIWEDEVYGDVYSHTIPANLQDMTYDGNVIGDNWDYGNKYALTITVYDDDPDPEERVAVSDKIYFWVYSTPTFEIVNIEDGATYTSSNIKPELVYQQNQGESLSRYKISLYDNNKKQINTSGDVDVVTSGSSAFPFYYNFVNLENDKDMSYYVRATGKTSEGTLLDTGYIGFSLDYTEAEGDGYLKLESDDYGTVTVTTNIIAVEPDEDPEEFIIENSQVELLDKSLTYDSNYDIEDNFTLSLKMTHTVTRSENPNSILIMRNGSHNIRLTSYVYDDDTLRYHLIVNNGLCDANYYSDALEVTDSDIVIVHIRRINDMYQLEALKSIQLR